jgi:hypothetical protein
MGAQKKTFRLGRPAIYLKHTNHYIHLPYGWRLQVFVCFVLLMGSKIVLKLLAAKKVF